MGETTKQIMTFMLFGWVETPTRQAMLLFPGYVLAEV
jgi:hypothetical protein